MGARPAGRLIDLGGGVARRGLNGILVLALLGLFVYLIPGQPTSVLAASAAPPTTPPPLEGPWKIGKSDEVDVTATGAASFIGTDKLATNPCFHPGDVPWHISGSGPHYTGTDEWRHSTDCSSAGAGATTWDLSGSVGDLTLHECTTNPENASETNCFDWKRQDPFVVITPSTLDAEQGLRRDVGALDFANQHINIETPEQTLTIANHGAGELNVKDIQVTGPFKVKNPEACKSSPIRPGGSCALQVTFEPTASGPIQDGELTITDDAPNSPQYVSLDGSGHVVLPPLPPASVAETEGKRVHDPCGTIPLGWHLLEQRPQTLVGAVVQSHIASEDAVVNHHNADFNFFVYADPLYRHLLAIPGNWHTADKYEKGRIEVEWEKRSAAWTGGLPSWAWPAQGDRIMTVGNHVFDCGHKDEGHRSEIHPPRFLAVYRNAALSRLTDKGVLGTISGRTGSHDPTGDTAATRVDVFASSYGGLAIRSEEGLGAGWFQPVNNRDYQFTVMAPPKPTPDAELTHWPASDVPRLAEHVPGLKLQFQELPGHDGYLVTLPFSQVSTPRHKLMVFGDTIWVGWKGDHVPKLQVRHYVVRLLSMHIRESLTGDWSFAGYANGEAQDNLLHEGLRVFNGNFSGLEGGVNPNNEPFAEVHDKQTIQFMHPPTFRVALLPGEPLRVAFRASAWTSLGAGDFMGTAEGIWMNPPSIERIFSSADLAVGHENDTDKACGKPCFSVFIQIAPA